MCPSCLVPGDEEMLLEVYPPFWFPRAGRGLWLFPSCLVPWDGELYLDVPLLPGSWGWGDIAGCLSSLLVP